MWPMGPPALAKRLGRLRLTGDRALHFPLLVDSTLTEYFCIFIVVKIHLNMNSNKKGDIGLTKAIADLTSKGYFTFLPISDTTCVDLVIANEDMKLKRCQVKYCALKNGAMTIQSQTVVNGKRVPIKLDRTDLWVVYCPDNANLYYVPTSTFSTTKNLNFLVDESRQINSTTRLASKYLDIRECW